MPKISTFLWFNDQAEDAAKFYTSVFEGSRIVKTVRIPAAGPDGNETAQLVEFQMNGQQFTALNGGPHFPFNEAISFVVHCETQEEVDRYWKSLSADGGQEVQCGWLKDKFGISWQVVPNILPQLMSRGDPVRSEAMMRALRTMKKLEISELKLAYENGASGE